MKATNITFHRGKTKVAIAMLAAFTFALASTTALAGDFSAIAFTGDSDSGVSSNKLYSHAYSLGASTDIIVNGVTFDGIAGVTPSATSKFVTGGFPNAYLGFSGQNFTGDIRGIMSNFVHGVSDAETNPTQTVILQNLKVGQSYTTTFYGMSWGQVGEREVTIDTSDGTNYVFDQNFTSTSGNYSGNLLQYTYTATEDTMEFTITPTVVNDSFHLYGFSNELNLAYDTFDYDKFSVSNYTGDADCGISSDKVYSHAYRVGSSTDVEINGVTFTGAVYGETGLDFSGDGFTGHMTGLTPSSNISGEVAKLTTDFYYSNAPDVNDQVVTLEGLVPGTEYELAIYSMSWSNNRTLLVSTSLGDTFAYDQNLNGNGANGNGIGNVLTYSYIATDETMSIAFAPTEGSVDGFHFYGFSNEVITAVPEPSTFVLLFGALLGVMAVRRTKK